MFAWLRKTAPARPDAGPAPFMYAGDTPLSAKRQTCQLHNCSEGSRSCPNCCESLLACAPLATPAFANDSTAELGAGGLQLVRTESIELLSEDLFVSEKEVRVTYHFRNKTDKPLTYVVAFPLPPVDTTVPEEAQHRPARPGERELRRFSGDRRRQAGRAVALGDAPSRSASTAPMSSRRTACRSIRSPTGSTSGSRRCRRTRRPNSTGSA